MTTNALISLLIIGLLLTSAVFATTSENTENKEISEKDLNNLNEEIQEDQGIFDVVMQILAVLFGK